MHDDVPGDRPRDPAEPSSPGPEPQDDVPGSPPNAGPEPYDDVPVAWPQNAGPGPYGGATGPYGPPPGAYGYGGPQPPPYGQPYGGPAAPYGPAAYGPGSYYETVGITSADDTTWALMAYLGQLAFGFLPPLIVYLSRKDRSPFVRSHAAQALNLMLTYLIVFVGGVLIAVTAAVSGVGPAVLLLAVPLVVAAAVTHTVFLIIGAVRAGRRELYKAPTLVCWPIIH